MNLLIELLKIIYGFGVLGVFFKLTTSLWLTLKPKSIFRKVRILVYSFISGGLWPGLIIAKLVV